MRNFPLFLVLAFCVAGPSGVASSVRAKGVLDGLKASLKPPAKVDVPSALCTVAPPQNIGFMMGPQTGGEVLMVDTGGAQLTVQGALGQTGRELESALTPLFSAVKTIKRTSRSFRFEAKNSVFGQTHFVYGHARAAKHPGPALIARVQSQKPIPPAWRKAIDKLVTSAKCRRPEPPPPVRPFDLGGPFVGSTVTLTLPRGAVVDPNDGTVARYAWPNRKIVFSVIQSDLEPRAFTRTIAGEADPGRLGPGKKYKRGMLYRAVKPNWVTTTYIEQTGGAYLLLAAGSAPADEKSALALLKKVVATAKRKPVKTSPETRKLNAFVRGRAFETVSSAPSTSRSTTLTFCNKGKVHRYYFMGITYLDGIGGGFDGGNEESDWGHFQVVGQRNGTALLTNVRGEQKTRRVTIGGRNLLVIGGKRYFATKNKRCP